jgi:hypothetical protein
MRNGAMDLDSLIRSVSDAEVLPRLIVCGDLTKLVLARRAHFTVRGRVTLHSSTSYSRQRRAISRSRLAAALRSSRHLRAPLSRDEACCELRSCWVRQRGRQGDVEHDFTSVYSCGCQKEHMGLVLCGLGAKDALGSACART